MEGHHDHLNQIEETLERLSKDLKVMTSFKSHVKNIKLAVSTSNLEGVLDEIPPSIDLNLPPIETKSPIKHINNMASSFRKTTGHADFKRFHFDTICKNPLLSLRDKKCVPLVGNSHPGVLQGNDEPLKVEEFCCAGHDLFAKQDWKGAMELYSRCILILMEEIDSNKDKGKPLEKQQQDLLLLVYSNRAETYLRLRKYEDALKDATKALALNAKHWISLVRKGKALDGLEQYEQSVACYVAALHEEPNDKCTRNALLQSKVSYEQAYKGVYDLTKFILSGSEGDLPFCRDFVGPLEIQRSPLGGRGLFATKDLAIGELVLVSNALLVAPKESMVRELSSLVLSSKRRMQQLYTLSRNLKKDVEDDMEIPPMELFTPRSYHNLKQTKCPYGRQSQLFDENFNNQTQESIEQQANLEHITQIVEVNAVNVMDVIACAEPNMDQENSTSVNYSGLWLLPSFINHSCTPNCVTSTPAGIAFVRVSRQIGCGEELTIAYFDVMKSLEVRKKMSQQCYFACKCPRCAWEQSYPKELRSAREKLLILLNRAIFDCMKCAYPISRLRILPQLASLILSFETIIQSVDLDVDYQNWLRASIMDTYLAASRLLMSARMYVQPANRIQMLNLLVDAIKAGGGGDGEVMGIGVMLLNQVELHHGKESKEYCMNEVTLRNIFKIFHGTLTKDVFHAMVASYSQLLNNLANKELMEAVSDLSGALVQLRDTFANNISHFSPSLDGVHASHPQDVGQIINHDCSDDEKQILEFLSKIKW